MESTVLPPADAALANLRRSAERWRRAHPGQVSLPEAIRQEAMELTRTHGCEAVAHALGISGSSVYRWLRQRAQHEGPPPNQTPTFVEVVTRPVPESAPSVTPTLSAPSATPAPSAMPAPSPTPAPVGPVTLELQSSEGSFLRIHLPAERSLDVLALVDVFLRGQPCSR